jgi:hypothetical protein
METLITWITAIVAAASVIANVTPSMRDNEIQGQIICLASPFTKSRHRLTRTKLYALNGGWRLSTASSDLRLL